VPDVVGFGASEACAIVQAAGLMPAGPDGTAAPTTGVITAQQPEAGASADRGTPVFLWTRGGPGAAEESVPPPWAPAVPQPV
jgi:hypothetical protein